MPQSFVVVVVVVVIVVVVVAVVVVIMMGIAAAPWVEAWPAQTLGASQETLPP